MMSCSCSCTHERLWVGVAAPQEYFGLVRLVSSAEPRDFRLVSEHHQSTCQSTTKPECVQVMATCGALAWAYIIMPAEPRKKTPVLQVLPQDSQKILHEALRREMLGTRSTWAGQRVQPACFICLSCIGRSLCQCQALLLEAQATLMSGCRICAVTHVQASLQLQDCSRPLTHLLQRSASS